jgi:CubicO group peptidase (beta-lactamase class C family)
MKLTSYLLIFITVVVVPACGQDNYELISRFENNINVHTLGEEGFRRSGEKATIQSRMEYYRVPGLSLSVIDGYKAAWQRSYGFLRAGNPAMVDDNSVFQAGSVSKFVTALLVMHYVERGIFDLDEDVNGYLKSWQLPVNEFNREHPVTLRHLLSHQSGLPSSNTDRDENQPMPSLVQILNAQPPAINKPASLMFAPGEKWSYSNIGYVVIQLMLEDTLGENLDTLAREVIFGPLGMDSSTFDYPLGASMRHREAMPHTKEGEVRDAAQDSLARAQGGLMTTTSDMVKLLIELMKAFKGESDTVISEATLKAMLERQVDVPRAALGFPIGMGLGVFVDGEGENVSMMHPGHSYPGSTFIVQAFPGLGQGVVMAVNGYRGDRLQIEAVSTLAEIYGWPSGDYFRE